jgi:hypothetical protein
MRHEKAAALLNLARTLASSAEGLTLDEMAQELGENRRTIERMRDALGSVFPQLEEVQDGVTKRFRIPGGLDGFINAPTKEELLELNKAIEGLRRQDANASADTLQTLEKKIRSAMKRPALNKVAPDLEVLLRAEMIAVPAGPRAVEDPDVLLAIRDAHLQMKVLQFVYHGGSRPGAMREVVPFGILFGRCNYLIAADFGTTKPKHYQRAASCLAAETVTLLRSTSYRKPASSVDRVRGRRGFPHLRSIPLPTNFAARIRPTNRASAPAGETRADRRQAPAGEDRLNCWHVPAARGPASLLRALSARHSVGVYRGLRQQCDTKLQEMFDLGFAGELGVLRLINESAACRRLPHQKIGKANPVALDQGSLINKRSLSGNGCTCRRLALHSRYRPGNMNGLPILGFEACQNLGFVLKSLGADKVDGGVGRGPRGAREP